VTAIAVCNHFFAGRFCHLIFIIGIDKRDIFFIGENQFTEHRSLFANKFGQLARIDAVNGRNFVFDKPFVQTFYGIPMTVFKRKIGNNKAGSLYFFRFVKSRNTVLGNIVRNAVIANERIGKRQNLTEIRWIGKAFDVAHHACAENNFAGNRAFVTK
jgi:hypothetical protein